MIANATQAINNLDREYRAAVAQALSICDGTLDSFESELNSMTWEYPDLPVADVMRRVQATLAPA